LSGPKIVRIVTREEIVALCQDQIAQLRAAIDRWARTGERNEFLTKEDLAAAESRIVEMHRLLASDRFVDVQKRVPEEIAYLKEDMTRRLDAAADKKADASTRQRRSSTAAGQLLARLAEKQTPFAPELHVRLNEIVSGTARNDVVDRTLAEALSLLVAKPASTLTEQQRARAEGLGGSAPPETLDDWITANAPASEATNVKLDKAISELVLAGAREKASAYAERQRRIPQESLARQRLLADSLLLEVAKDLADCREQERALAALSQHMASLAAVTTPAARQLEEQARTALAASDPAAAKVLVPRIATLITSARKALAAESRRRAVLHALAQLGYEVREGMQTAAVDASNVVLCRAANPSVGLEIAGSPDTDRLQLRPVRIGNATQSDRDIETAWCTDFEQLKQQLGSGKGDFIVDRAVAVGEVPVKVLHQCPVETDSRRTVPAPKARHRD
jgi:hypothetical protein